ncbi:hypothetical protein TBLA_0A01160 [Henningerozyma blattae CBS 6284]|uniref:Alpha-1,3-mannosyltransferase n=1 Tax=Henningerozyma blattae (strain ATCC 34711 / CBS 6284 / DSM 70876 / NBRC 10599 / NRRL Y-10934 / UCD 77-7) TaxID=1071380 RepID=I2GUW4_HENB6|nr:hypothetical protein TBLA_0A01160 [Tetrapisispora blattae CBS 6284]CCH57916.1 hypothetical protein TBLA_0A01160 [Tetrapisispora blattae CBS 6284]
MNRYFRLRRLLSKKLLFLLIIIGIGIVSYSDYLIRQNHKRVDFAKNLSINDKPTKGSSQRPALAGSIFNVIESHRQRAELSNNVGHLQKLWNFFNLDEKYISTYEQNILINWDNSTQVERIDKCRYLIDTYYRVDPNWANNKIMEFYNIEETDNLYLSLLAERQRIYDYCFLKGGLKPTDVFDYSNIPKPANSNGKAISFPVMNVDPSDFQDRMYPFLRRTYVERGDSEQLPLYPRIFDLTTGIVQPLPIDKIDANYNKNFWNNWASMASGKGIVTTFKESDLPLFRKQLAVLEHLNNKHPIQIISAKAPTQEFLDSLILTVQKTTQKVYLLDCSTMLDEEFSKNYIVNFLNKWVAMLFNTFKEAIFLDVDAIPFIGMDYFFENEGFEETGILMYKDRVMRTEHTFQYCIDMFHEAEPSNQETNLIHTGLKFDSTTNKFDSSSAADMAYKTFFRNLQLHHVDSGIVAIDKVEKLSGLLLSFLFHIDAKVKRCVYGDKEIFWIGQLFAGEDFYIDPVDGSIIGPMMENVNPDTEKVESHICATQIAHSDALDTLLWTNGGLKTCKFPNSAENDFKKYPDYFKDRYGDEVSLKKIYSAPLRIEGLIVPDSDRNPWLHIRECSEYVYCAFAGNDLNDPENTLGHTINFNDEEVLQFNKISELWNQS